MGRHTGPSTLQRWWMARGRRGAAGAVSPRGIGRRGWRALVPVGLGVAAAGTYAAVVLIGHPGAGAAHVRSRPATTTPVATAAQGRKRPATAATSAFAAAQGASPTPLPALSVAHTATGHAASEAAVQADRTPQVTVRRGSASTPAAQAVSGRVASTSSSATSTSTIGSTHAKAATGVSAPASQGHGSASGVRTPPSAVTMGVTGRTAAAAPPVLIPPVVGRVLSGFGWQYSKVFGDWQEHTGVDLAARVGQMAVSPGAGQVLAVVHDRLWGWVVSIGLDRGYSTNVSGLASVQVRFGQAVQAGTPLGAVGDAPPAEAGLAPHVFWQLFAGARALDPQLATSAVAR